MISASLQACGVVFPFAISTSICRSSVTTCSGLYLFIGNLYGVRAHLARDLDAYDILTTH